MTQVIKNTQWKSVQPIIFTNNTLELLDQRILPQKKQYLTFTDPAEVAKAISNMVVRGAPAIGITAAFGIVLAALQQLTLCPLKIKKKYANLI
jgi:methylthioribose-1-phosphate isomerase